MRKLRHPALALFVLATLSPTVALAQPEKVGVVTTLEGNVTARRAVLPLPVPLNFKDDVFFRDTITTGDQSLARVLLGGKSIVTIRERSVVTITESPGRSFISLESGKIGLAVARDKLAPGESVDVRTPNAVVGVRGTVIVAEVLPAAAAVVSNVYFLRGFGECFVVDQQTGRPIGPSVTLKPLEAFKVIGSTARVDPIPPSQLGQITAGLEGRGIQHKEAANQEQVKTQIAQATNAVLGALLGGPGGQAAVANIVAPVASQPPNPITPNPVISVVVPTTGINTQPCAPNSQNCGVSVPQTVSGSGPTTVPPAPTPVPAPVPFAVPSNITIDPVLAPFLAATAPASTPVATIPAGVAELTILGSAFQVETTTPVPANLERPLFQATDAKLTIGDNLLNVLGSFSSTSSLPVLSTDPTTIRTGGDFIRIAPGGTLSVSSSLVSDTGGTLTAGGSLISIEGGGSLTSTGASPVIQFNNTNVNVAGDLVRLTNGGTLTLSASGPLLVDSDSRLVVNHGDVLRIDGSGSKLASQSAEPLLGFTGSKVHVPTRGEGGGDLVRIRDSAEMSLQGPLLRTSNSAFELGGILLRVVHGSTLTMTSAAPEPLIQLAGGNLSTGNDLVRFGSPEGFDHSVINLPGTLVSLRDFSNESLHIGSGMLLRVSGGTSVSTGGSVFELNNVHLMLPGPLARIDEGSTLTTSALVTATTSSITLPNEVLNLSRGSKFTMTGGPFARISGGSLTADTLVRADGLDSTVNLTGGFLDLSNNAVVTLGQIANTCDCHFASNLTLTLGPNQPVIRTSSSTLNVEGGQSLVSFVTEGSTAQSGVALIATGTASAPSIININGTGLELGGVGLTDPNPQLQLSQTTLDQTGFNSLIEISGLPVTAVGPLLSARSGSTIEVARQRLLDVNGIFTVNGRGLGALLQFADSTVSTGSEIVFVGSGGRVMLDRGLIDAVNTTFSTSTFDTFFTVARGGSVTATTADPFIRLANATTVTMLEGEDLIHVGVGSSDAARASLNIIGGGPLVKLQAMNLELRPGTGVLLRVTGSDVSAAGPLLDMVNTNLIVSGPVLKTEGGSTITTSAGPVIRISGGSLTADVLASTDGARNLLNLTGPVLGLTNTNVTLRRVSDEPTGSTDIFALTLARKTPVIRMEGSTLTTTGVDADLVDVGGGVATQGAALTATTGSTVNLSGSLLRIRDVTSMATDPLVQLANTTINQMLTAKPLILVESNPRTTTLTGQLLTAADSVIGTSGSFAHFTNGALIGTGTNPLVSLSRDRVVSAGNFMLFDSAFTLDVSSPLLQAAASTLNNGDPATNPRSFVGIFDSSSVKSSTANALVGLDTSSVVTSGSFVSLRRSGLTPSTIDLTGPLLKATGGSITPFSTALRDASGVPILCCDLLSVGQSATLASKTTDALVQLDHVSIPNANRIVAVFDVASIAGEPVAGGPARVTLAGPLVSAAGGAINALQEFVGVFRSSLKSTTTAPLIQLADITVALGGANPFGGPTTAGRLFSTSASASVPAAVNLAGPLFSASNTIVTTTDDTFGVFNGAALKSTTASPLISISGGSVTAAEAGNFFVVASSVGLPPSVSIAGPLLSAVNTTLTNGDPKTNTNSFAFVGDSGTLTSTTSSPLFMFDHAVVDTSGNVFTVRRSNTTTAATTVTLAGPLLAAVSSSFNTSSRGLGSPCCSGFFVGEAARFTSTTPLPLIDLTSSTFNAGPDVQSGGSFFTVADASGAAGLVAPGTLTLAGPLLKASNSIVSALFNLLTVTRSSLSSTSEAALVQLGSGSSLTLGGANPFAGSATTIGRALSVVSSAVSGTVASPASVALAGPFLQATNSTLTITGDVIGVLNGASFTSTTSLPLITSTNSTYNLGSPPGITPSSSRHLLVVGDVGGLTGSRPASVSLMGPLISSSSDVFNVTGPFVQTFPGAGSGIFLTRSNDTSYFMQFSGSTVELGAAAGGLAGTGNFLQVDAGTGMSLNGPVASVAAGATPWTVDSLVNVRCGAGAPCTTPTGLPTPGLDTNGNTSALLSFTGVPTGGPHQVTRAMFDLAGAATTTVDSDPDAPTPTLLGTDRPLRHGGALFEGSSTSVSTNQVVKLDTALLEATAPILKLMNSTLTSSVDVLNLSLKAKLSATLLPGDALVKLNASTLNVNSGSLVNVAGGSFANLRGSLVGLDNNSTLNILAGSLFTVSGGSVFKLTGGSLGVFGSTGTNTINITNNAQLCIGCSIVTNIMNFNFPVLLKNGASAGNVNVGTGFTPFAGLSMTNKVNISGPSGAVFVLDGSTSKVKLGP